MLDGIVKPIVMVTVHGNSLPRIGNKFVENWTEQQKEILIDLWEKGIPCREIGNRIGKTKNAVIGKAHRLKLPHRTHASHRNETSYKAQKAPRPPRPKKPKPLVTEMITRKPKPPTFLAEPVPLDGADPITIMQLGNRTCRAIVGHGENGLAVYCGNMTFWDDRCQRYKSFCAAHSALYYQPTRYRA